MFATSQHFCAINRCMTRCLRINTLDVVPRNWTSSMTVCTSMRNYWSTHVTTENAHNTQHNRELQSLLEELASNTTTTTQPPFHTMCNKEVDHFKEKLDVLLALRIKANNYNELHSLYKLLLVVFIKYKLSNTMCEEMYNKARLYFHQIKSKSEEHPNEILLSEQNKTKEREESAKGEVESNESERTTINEIRNNSSKEMEHMYFTFAQYLTEQINLRACKESEQNVCEVLQLLNTSVRILLIDAAEDSHFDANRFSSLLLIAQNLIILQVLTINHWEIVSSHLERNCKSSTQSKETKKFAILSWLNEFNETQMSLAQEEKHCDNCEVQNSTQTMSALKSGFKNTSKRTNADDVMLACVHKVFTNPQAPEQVKVKMLACYFAYRLARNRIVNSLFSEYINANYKSLARQCYYTSSIKVNEEVNSKSEHHVPKNDDESIEVNNKLESLLEDNLNAAFLTSLLVSELITDSECEEMHREERERFCQECLQSPIFTTRIRKAMLSTLFYMPTQHAHSLPCSLPMTEHGHAPFVVIITQLLMLKLMDIKKELITSGNRENEIAFYGNNATRDSAVLLMKEWEDTSMQVVIWLRQVILCHYKFCLTFTYNEHSRRLKAKHMQVMEQALWKLILQAANDNLFVSRITSTDENATTSKEKQQNHQSCCTNSKECSSLTNAANVPYVVRELILPFYGPAQWKANTVNEFIRLAFDWNLTKVMQEVFYNVYYRERSILEELLEQVLQKEQHEQHSINHDNNDEEENGIQYDYNFVNNDDADNSNNNNGDTFYMLGKCKSNREGKKTISSFTPSLTFDSCVLLLESCWSEVDSNDKNVTSSKQDMSKDNSSCTNNAMESTNCQTLAQRNSIMCANVIRYTLLSMRLAKHKTEYCYSIAVNKNKNKVDNFTSPSLNTPLAVRKDARVKMYVSLLAETNDQLVVNEITDYQDEAQTLQLQRINEQLEWVRRTAIPKTTQIFSHTQMSRDDAFDWTSLY